MTLNEAMELVEVLLREYNTEDLVNTPLHVALARLLMKENVKTDEQSKSH